MRALWTGGGLISRESRDKAHLPTLSMPFALLSKTWRWLRVVDEMRGDVEIESQNAPYSLPSNAL